MRIEVVVIMTLFWPVRVINSEGFLCKISQKQNNQKQRIPGYYGLCLHLNFQVFQCSIDFDIFGLLYSTSQIGLDNLSTNQLTCGSIVMGPPQSRLELGPTKWLPTGGASLDDSTIWVNYNDRTLFSLTGIMVNKGNHPNIASFQLCEVFFFAQIFFLLLQTKLAGVWYPGFYPSFVWLTCLVSHPPEKMRSSEREERKAALFRTMRSPGVHIAAFSDWFFWRFSDIIAWYNPWRIHGASIYANMTGVYWWDPCYHI